MEKTICLREETSDTCFLCANEGKDYCLICADCYTKEDINTLLTKE